MPTRYQQALALWEQGTERLLDGKLHDSVRLFTESIELCPTAEAHTFRGWAYSMAGDYDEAIADCHRAIELDPDFGNPYNDIGAYLVALDRPQEAIQWFEQAKRARRYEPRHYPYLNLGRLYALQGHHDLAAVEFQQALEHHPGDPLATAYLERHPVQVN